ncbi:MAG: hypothetical protein LBD72_02805 [Puniceicoccales bacterium]|jgi:hypothetical protein|nr:hypothetical protein [Puniceicoccales bacterium]
MQYEQDKIYEIVTPLYGALFFKYNNTAGGMSQVFSSVDGNGDALKVRIHGVDSSDGTIKAAEVKQLVLSASDVQNKGYTIGAVDDCKILKFFTNPSLGDGVQLNVDPTSDKYESDVMQALMEDSATMTLYTCVQAMMPYMITMANATKCLSSSQISFDMINMRHSQEVHQKNVAMAKMMEEIRNSKLMKFLSSPWFTLILVLAAVLIAVLCLLTAGALAVILTVVVVAVVIAVMVPLLSVYYSQDKASMEKLKEDLGYSEGVAMQEDIQEMYDKAHQALDVAFGVALAIVAVSVIAMAVGGGFVSSTATKIAQQIARTFATEVTKGILRAAMVVAVAGMASSLATAVVSMTSGLYSIVEAIVMKAAAAIERAIGNVRAQIDGLSAMSRLFKDLISRMEQSLRVLMETLQDLIKSQGEIIKTLGEGSRAITRNLAGI